jgi:hypothetical protein
MTEKGYALSLDALLALFLFMSLLAFLQLNIFPRTEFGLELLSQQQRMDDLFDLLDDNQTLQSMDANAIQQQIDAVNGFQFNYRIEIEEYRYQANDFTLNNSITFGEELANKRTVHGRRLFLTFDNDAIEYYYTAEYWSWLR